MQWVAVMSRLPTLLATTLAVQVWVVLPGGKSGPTVRVPPKRWAAACPAGRNPGSPAPATGAAASMPVTASVTRNLVAKPRERMG